MKSKLAIAVRTIALRDYTVTCREDGRWIVTALPESDAPMLLIDAGTKADARLFFGLSGPRPRSRHYE